MDSNTVETIQILLFAIIVLLLCGAGRGHSSMKLPNRSTREILGLPKRKKEKLK